MIRYTISCCGIKQSMKYKIYSNLYDTYDEGASIVEQWGKYCGSNQAYKVEIVDCWHLKSRHLNMILYIY